MCTVCDFDVSKNSVGLRKRKTASSHSIVLFTGFSASPPNDWLQTSRIEELKVCIVLCNVSVLFCAMCLAFSCELRCPECDLQSLYNLCHFCHLCKRCMLFLFTWIMHLYSCLHNNFSGMCQSGFPLPFGLLKNMFIFCSHSIKCAFFCPLSIAYIQFMKRNGMFTGSCFCVPPPPLQGTARSFHADESGNQVESAVLFILYFSHRFRWYNMKINKPFKSVLDFIGLRCRKPNVKQNRPKSGPLPWTSKMAHFWKHLLLPLPFSERQKFRAIYAD